MENKKYNEELERDLYSRKIALGEAYGPLTGKPSIDKPWLKYYSENALKKELPQMTVFDYLYEQNKDYLGRYALNYFGRKISFDELFENIFITAEAFKAMGVKKGDVVSISLPNMPEAIYMFYALSLLGATSNMIDPRTSADGIEKYVEEADSKLFVIIDVALDKVTNIKKNTKTENIIAVSPADSFPFALNLGYKVKSFIDSVCEKKGNSINKAEFIKWKEFYKLGLDNYDKSTDFDTKYKTYLKEVPFEKNRALVIEHTGGTTGIPKGVVLTNENINAVAIQSVLTGIDMQRTHNWLGIMPPFIAYGVGQGLHLPLTVGMETILIPQFDPKKFDELLVKYKPIHMVGVPSYWGTIINSEKLKNSDLSYIIAPTVGGDAMDITLERNANKFLKDHNCKYGITKGYGMTEVTGGVAGTVDENNEIGSVGIPFVKTIISIFDTENGQELSYNETGEICITGPNMMLGYFKNQEATDNILKLHEDGRTWVHSGDLGYMTENGNIFVVGRMKNMIIRYDGFKIFPSLIENAILSHESVSACKVVGMRDYDHSQGKLPCAFVILKEEYKELDFEQLEREIYEVCLAKLPEYALPKLFRFRQDFPYTSIGKINVLELEKEIDTEIRGNVKPKALIKTINKN